MLWSSLEYTSIVGGSIHTAGCFTSHTGGRRIRFKIHSRFEIVCPIPTLFQVSNTIATGERLYCDEPKSGLQCYHHVQWCSRVLGGSMSLLSRRVEVGGDFNTCSGGVSPSSLSSDSYGYSEGIKIRSAQNINSNNYLMLKSALSENEYYSRIVLNIILIYERALFLLEISGRLVGISHNSTQRIR